MNKTELVERAKETAYSIVAVIYLISALFAFLLAFQQFRSGKVDEISWISYALLTPIALGACLAILMYATQFALHAVTILGIADIPPFSGWYKHVKEKTEREEELEFRRKVLEELAECRDQLRDLQSRLGANRSLNYDRWMDE